MPDYKEMYLTLFRATEKAIGVLIDAQQECEEMYLNAPEPELILLERTDAEKNRNSTGSDNAERLPGPTGRGAVLYQ